MHICSRAIPNLNPYFIWIPACTDALLVSHPNNLSTFRLKEGMWESIRRLRPPTSLMFLSPLPDTLKISALLYHIELSRVHLLLRQPFHRHYVQISVTHERLAEVIEAMLLHHVSPQSLQYTSQPSLSKVCGIWKGHTCMCLENPRRFMI